MAGHEDARGQIDRYLARLRAGLARLGQAEVDEILREIRGHILEQTETDNTPEHLQATLAKLGSPEQLASLYQTESVLARVRDSGSHLGLVRGVFCLARRSVLGLVAAVTGLVGYLLALWCLSLGIMKIIWPENVGVWWGPEERAFGYNVTTINGSLDLPPDLLGWWLVPAGLFGCTLLIMATGRVLRWILLRARPVQLPGPQGAQEV